MNYNRTILSGNLTRDPEIRHTQSGATVANFGMALNRKFKTESGEMREEVTFLDLTAFGSTAERIAQYCRKGTPLFVEGRLKLETWETKQGEKRSKLIVICEQFQFVERKSDSRPTAPTPSEPGQAAPAQSDASDDVPF